MNSNEKNQSKPKKSKKCTGSIILYVASLVVAVIAIALLVNNVRLYNENVAQYVAQGYPKAEVVKQLKAIQLIPGVFEPIAVYGGIAFVLFGIGMINEKVSKYLATTAKVKAIDDVQEDIADAENIETSEKVETDAENAEASEKVEVDAENVDASEKIETAAEANETTDDIK